MARKHIIFASAVLPLAIVSTGCSEVSDDPRDYVSGLLERGSSGLDCYESNWSKGQPFEQPLPGFLDDHNIRFESENALWARSDDAVRATVRAEYGGYLWEYTVIGFGSDHYYDGYYCSRAAIPLDQEAPPIGAMTDSSTAMDRDFRPIE